MSQSVEELTRMLEASRQSQVELAREVGSLQKLVDRLEASERRLTKQNDKLIDVCAALARIPL